MHAKNTEQCMARAGRMLPKATARDQQDTSCRSQVIRFQPLAWDAFSGAHEQISWHGFDGPHERIPWMVSGHGGGHRR